MKLPKPPVDEKDGAPKSLWDKIITSTPVVMTVLATLLAGLSSSESSQGQYYRSLSAQHQSKASDQWGLFQAKKIRSADAHNTLTVMQNVGDTAGLSMDAFASAITDLVGKLEASAGGDNPAMKSAVTDARAVGAEIEKLAADPIADAALSGTLPHIEAKPIPDETVRRAVEALRRNSVDSVDPALFAPVKDAALHNALLVAEENAAVSDAADDPISKFLGSLEDAVNRLAAARASAYRKKVAATTTSPATAAAAHHVVIATDRTTPAPLRQLANDLSAARYRFESARLSREAEANQAIAYLYDVAVMRTSIESDRHRVRSRYFFIGMLGAQAATVVASLALAARERNTLWILAASIGILAGLYAAYVYLFT